MLYHPFQIPYQEMQKLRGSKHFVRFRWIIMSPCSVKWTFTRAAIVPTTTQSMPDNPIKHRQLDLVRDPLMYRLPVKRVPYDYGNVIHSIDPCDESFSIVSNCKYRITPSADPFSTALHESMQLLMNQLDSIVP